MCLIIVLLGSLYCWDASHISQWSDTLLQEFCMSEIWIPVVFIWVEWPILVSDMNGEQQEFMHKYAGRIQDICPLGNLTPQGQKCKTVIQQCCICLQTDKPGIYVLHTQWYRYMLEGKVHSLSVSVPRILWYTGYWPFLNYTWTIHLKRIACSSFIGVQASSWYISFQSCIMHILIQLYAKALEKWGQMTHTIEKYGDICNFSGVTSVILPFMILKYVGTFAPTAKIIGDIPDFNVLNVPKTQPQQNPAHYSSF